MVQVFLLELQSGHLGLRLLKVGGGGGGSDLRLELANKLHTWWMHPSALHNLLSRTQAADLLEAHVERVEAARRANILALSLT